MSKIDILKKCDLYYTYDIGTIPTKEELFVYIIESEYDKSFDHNKILKSLDLDYFFYLKELFTEDYILKYIYEHKNYQDEIFEFFNFFPEQLDALKKSLKNKKENEIHFEYKLKGFFLEKEINPKYKYNDLSSDVNMNKANLSDLSKEYLYKIFLEETANNFNSNNYGSCVKFLDENQQINLIKDLFLQSNSYLKDKKIIPILKELDSSFVLEFAANYFKNKLNYLEAISHNKNINSKTLNILLNIEKPEVEQIKENLLKTANERILHKPLFDLLKNSYGEVAIDKSLPYFDDYNFYIEKHFEFVVNKEKCLYIKPEYYTKEFLDKLSEKEVSDLILKEKILDKELIPKEYKSALKIFNFMYEEFDENIYDYDFPVPKHLSELINFHLSNDSFLSKKYIEELLYKKSLEEISNINNIFFKEKDLIKILNEDLSTNNKILTLRHPALSLNILFSFEFDEFINENHTSELIRVYQDIKKINNEKQNFNFTENMFFKYYDYFEIDHFKAEYIQKHFDLDKVKFFLNNKPESINKNNIEFFIYEKNNMEFEFEF